MGDQQDMLDVARDRAELVLVNENAKLHLVPQDGEAQGEQQTAEVDEACGAESCSARLADDLTPRVHRLARKAPLVDDEENAEQTVQERRHRRLALHVSLPPSRSRTRTSLYSGSTGSLNSETGRQKSPLDAGTQDPFYVVRRRMVEPRRHEAWNRMKKGVNKLMGFMFSHIGLFLVVVVYAMVGGLVFPPMEKETEITRRQELDDRTRNMSDSLLEIIYNVSLDLLSSTEYHVDDELIRMCEEIRKRQEYKVYQKYQNTLAEIAPATKRRRKRSTDLYAKFTRLWRRQHHSRLRMQVEEHITQFKKDVYVATMNGWDGTSIDKQTQWTFAGSTLYSITVITTIGYGHLVPRTPAGRVVTILYALIGIPLTLLCVASMGSLFASMFRETYMYFYERWCAPRVRTTTKRNDDSRNLTRLQRLKLRILPWRSREHRQALARCLYNSAMAIGTGKEMPHHDDQCSTLQAIKRDSQKLLVRQKVRVPVYITLLGIVFYMLLGASMFSIWEGWSFFDAFYFSFITLSTIGFGDYVPGTTLKQQEEDSQGKLVLCCLYLIFGLGMMSMTIQLMQDSVKESFILAAQKLGIIEKRDNSITAQTKEKSPAPT